MDLLAEDLLLLLVDEHSGRPLVDSTRTTHALAGALVLELAVMGLLVPDDPAARRGRSKIVAVGQPPGDPLLDLAWQAFSDKPRRAASVLQRLHSKVTDPLLQRIADKGWVRPARTKVLGMFTRTSWPEVDGRHEAQLRNNLAIVLLQGGTPDVRVAALISLLLAADALPTLFPEADKKQMKARAKALSDGEWAGAAVAQAIAEVRTAVMVAVMTNDPGDRLLRERLTPHRHSGSGRSPATLPALRLSDPTSRRRRCA